VIYYVLEWTAVLWRDKVVCAVKRRQFWTLRW